MKLINNVNNKIFDINYKLSIYDKLAIFININLLRKKKLNVIFIGNNRQIDFKYCFYDKKNYFSINGKSFTFNEDCFYLLKGHPTLFIYEDNPIPLFLSKTEINSKMLDEFLKSATISQLMKEDTGIFGMNINKDMVTIILIFLVFIFALTQGYLNDFL